MATKPTTSKKANAKVERQVTEDSRRSDAGADQPVPESARTNGERDGTEVRTPTVGEDVTTSFDERTSAQAPWLRKDGSQDNGARDLDAPEGARAAQSREGDKTTVEETEKAIKDGVVEGPQRVFDPETDKPKNPVK